MLWNVYRSNYWKKYFQNQVNIKIDNFINR